VEQVISRSTGAVAAAHPNIRVRGLRRVAGATGDEILRGVDLDTPRGVVMGVIEPRGSGKSTLLRALNQLWERAPGAVLLDGADIHGLDVLALRCRVGMVFQLPAMFDGRCVRALVSEAHHRNDLF
jgi:ABC-type phosphate transport system ATPase subunit